MSRRRAGLESLVLSSALLAATVAGVFAFAGTFQSSRFPVTIITAGITLVGVASSSLVTTAGREWWNRRRDRQHATRRASQVLTRIGEDQEYERLRRDIIDQLSEREDETDPKP